MERKNNMKLKKEFIVHESGGEYMLVATGKAKFSGLVRGNKTVGDILELLKKDTTADAVVDAMLEKYDAPREKVEQDVKKVISELKKIGAIDG